MSKNENFARPRSDFIYTKIAGRPGSDFIYTKIFAWPGSNFLYTKNFIRKIMKINGIFKNFPRCARHFVKEYKGNTYAK